MRTGSEKGSETGSVGSGWGQGGVGGNGEWVYEKDKCKCILKKG